MELELGFDLGIYILNSCEISYQLFEAMMINTCACEQGHDNISLSKSTNNT